MTLCAPSLEEFDDLAGPRRSLVKSATAWQEERNAAYAEGFEAGREYEGRERDASEGETLREIARAVEELDFTYVAARRHVLASLDPLMRRIAAVLLPTLAEAGLAETVVSEVASLAARQADIVLRVRVGEGRAASITRALEGRAGVHTDISEDPAMGSREINIAVGGAERHVDLDAAVAQIAQRLADFLDPNEEEPSHG